MLGTVSIIIPSRLAAQPASAGGGFLLDRALSSIRTQTIRVSVQTQVIVGIDRGAEAPPSLVDCCGDLDVEFVESSGRSQAAALNAAARCARGDYLACLEDDDAWEPTFLAYAHAALSDAAFVSSTQIEVDERGNLIRLNDFPTPSGWMMRRSTWQAVGQFDQTYRWHLDSDWLGRLRQRKINRAHLAEAAAPSAPDPGLRQRPYLARLSGDPLVRVLRQPPAPLVRRTIHPGSGTARIEIDPIARARSNEEIGRLKQRFGVLPV